MKTRTGSKGNTIRLVVMVAIVTLLATLQGAEARQSDSTSNDNTHVQVAMCELAGGRAEVLDEYDPSFGSYASAILCHGGLLDGMLCINNSAGSACYFIWHVSPADDAPTGPTDGVEVAPEPTEAPVIVDEPVDLEPVVDPGADSSGSAGETLDPQPTPTAELIVDETIIVEEVAPPTDGGEETGGRDLPELQDDVVIDEVVEPGKGDDSGKGELPVINSPIDLSAPADAPIAGS